jgi:type I restriction-modification system DNA methylase subunit
MNKQQLANKIWESANKMRSKIEANEYKDYILGFIFYKFLSDKEVKYLKSIGFDDDTMDQVTEDVPDLVENVQKKSDTSSLMKTFFQHGLIWDQTLMFQMSGTLFLRSAGLLIIRIKKYLIRFLIRCKPDYPN